MGILAVVVVSVHCKSNREAGTATNRRGPAFHSYTTGRHVVRRHRSWATEQQDTHNAHTDINKIADLGMAFMTTFEVDRYRRSDDSWREQAITLIILPRFGSLCNGDLSTVGATRATTLAERPHTQLLRIARIFRPIVWCRRDYPLHQVLLRRTAALHRVHL